MLVGVGVFVGVDVAVLVGVGVAVGVAVSVGVGVTVGVFVGVGVGPRTDVFSFAVLLPSFDSAIVSSGSATAVFVTVVSTPDVR